MPTLSDPLECSLPGSSVHGVFQARVLEWGATAFSTPLYICAKFWEYTCGCRMVLIRSPGINITGTWTLSNSPTTFTFPSNITHAFQSNIIYQPPLLSSQQSPLCLIYMGLCLAHEVRTHSTSSPPVLTYSNPNLCLPNYYKWYIFSVCWVSPVFLFLLSPSLHILLDISFPTQTFKLSHSTGFYTVVHWSWCLILGICIFYLHLVILPLQLDFSHGGLW